MNNERMYSILIAPHVSEKSALIGELANQYAFKVNHYNKLIVPHDCPIILCKEYIRFH